MEDLMKAVVDRYLCKNTRYNSVNLLYYCWGNPDGKRTIEFRQHESDLDADRIIQWIKTVVGIVNFVHTESQTSLVQLFRRAIEEGDWTVIDLLRNVRLDEQAEFYCTRLHNVDAPPHTAPTGWDWAYKAERKNGTISQEEFQKQHQLRLLWEQYQIAWLAQPGDETSWFDPDDEQWPTHTRHVSTNTAPNSSPSESDHAKIIRKWEDNERMW